LKPQEYALFTAMCKKISSSFSDDIIFLVPKMISSFFENDIAPKNKKYHHPKNQIAHPFTRATNVVPCGASLC
jgi:hypothetical protein